MEQFDQYKRKIEKDIVGIAINEYGKSNLTKEQLKQIAQFTIEGMKKTNSKEEVLSFLKSLSAKWSIFNNIVIIEEGEYKEDIEKAAYSVVLGLAKQGKIDEAINLSKSMTN